MTSSDFLSLFNLALNDFLKPIEWIGTDVGFSILKDQEANYASLYKIGLNKDKEGILKNLWVSATYGKKSDGGISIGEQRSTWKPVDVTFNDHFFYNTETGKFIERSGKEIQPEQIWLRLNKAHLRNTKWFSGFSLRIKLGFWRKFLPFLIKVLDRILAFLLELFTGEVVKDKDIVKRFVNQWHVESNRGPHFETDADDAKLTRNIKTPKMWSFLGFEATRWSVVFYSIVNIFLYFFSSLFWQVENPIITNFFEDSFLILCYVATSFSVIEYLIPLILKIGVRKMPKVYHEVAFKRLKIKI